MKRYIHKTILAIIALLFVTPNIVAQVDLQSSFMVLRNDNRINGILEGGEWIIRFSDTDTLGNEYHYPVAMQIQSVVARDTTYVPMQSVDSVMFQLPDPEIETGIFNLTEEHLKYIVATDSVSTVNFRIDCLSKIELPKVGQKVFCDILRDPLPFGLIGRVESFKVSYDDGWVQMKCEPLTLSEIYKKYYKVSLTDDEGNAVNPEKRRTYSLNPHDTSLTEYEITEKPSGIPIKSVGYVVFDGKWVPHLTNNVNSISGNHRAELGFDIDGSITVWHVSAIDRERDLDYTEVYADFDLLAKLHAKLSTCQYEKSYGGWAGDRFSYEDKFEFEFPPIPTPVPGLGVYFSAGLKVNASLDIALFLKPEIPIRKRVGAHLDGLNSRLIWEDLPGGQKPENNVSASLNPSFMVSGKMSFGPYIEFGLTLAKLLDLGIELNPTVELSGKLEFAPSAAIGAVDNLANADISDMKKNYTSLVENNSIDLSVGVKLDGVATLELIDEINVSFVQLLKDMKILKGDPFMFPAFKLSALPTFTCSDYMFMATPDEDFYSVTFDKLNLEAPVMSLFSEGGIFFLDKNNKYITHVEAPGSGISLFDNSMEYSLGKHLRGSKVSVYPYVYTPFTGYVTPGVTEENIYISFQPTIDVVGDVSYDAVNFKATFPDDEVKNNPDKYTKTGVLVRALVSDDVLLDSRHFDFKMTDGQIDGKIERHAFQNFFGNATKGYISAFVYDPDDSTYSYSDEEPFEFYDLQRPTTLPATEITHNSAILHAKLHDDIIYGLNDGNEIKVGFLYHIPGKSGTTREIEFSSNDFEFVDNAYSCLITDLRAATEYEYYAYTRINGIRYDGDKYVLTTAYPFYNLRSEEGSDFAILYADICSDFVDPNSYQDLYFELVEYGKDFKDGIGKRVGETDWTIHEDGSATIDVMFTELLPDQLYSYRLVMVDAYGEKIISETENLLTNKFELKATTGSSSVTGNTVKIKGSLSSDLVELLKSQGVEDVYFDYSKDADMTSGSTVKLTLKSNDYSTTLSNLSYGTIYYYQFYAIDLDETRYEGDVLSFVTDDAPVENVEECYTLEASVEDAKVVMNGGVPSATLIAIENGVYKNMQYGFEVAESKSGLKGVTPTFTTSEIDMDTGMFTITKVLQPNTTYYIRAMVFFNDKWVAAPEIVSVKTLDFDPGIIPPDVEKE